MQENKNVMSMEVHFDFVTGGQQIKVSVVSTGLAEGRFSRA